MRVFNRVVMVIAILVGIAGALLLAVYPLEAVKIVRGNVDLFEESLFNDQSYMVFLIGVAVWLLVLLVLLVLELQRPRRKSVRIRTKSGANAMLGIDSVAQSLEFRIDELAGVRKVQPRINSRGKDVEVVVDLDTSPSVNIPVLTDQVVELCRDIVEGQLGVKIHGKVAINVHHEPYPRGTMPPTQPLAKGTEAIATQPRLVEPAPDVQPKQAPAAAPAPVAQPSPQQAPEAQPVREPRFRRKVKATPPEPEPVVAISPAPAETPAPEPTVVTPAPSGPAPLGDLEPLDLSDVEPESEPKKALELDDLDLYDPTVRDE